jgi:hypothetical protein
MAAGDIDDAESAVAQVRPIVVVVAEIVRAPVANLVGHTDQLGYATGRGRGGNEAGNAAHGY